MTRRRPVLFGEILFDRYPDGTAVLGGAPLNVAAHLAGLGEEPLMISRVGDDEEGRLALKEMERRAIDASAVQLDPSLPTGEVRVELVDGEPRYDIVEHRAWDAIDPDQAQRALTGVDPSLVYHGTLAARSRTSAECLDRLREGSRGRVLVDVNLRPPWTPVKTAARYCRGATHLKLNAAELDELGASRAGRRGGFDARAVAFLEDCEARSMVVTMGSEGARMYFGAEEPLDVPSRPVPEVAGGDPVGAGDAFAAVWILGELRDWDIRISLERASEMAAAVCGLHGALPEDSGWHDEFRRGWA